MVEFIAERFNYAVVIVLMMTGLYVVFSTGNLVKKLVGLSVFQTSVFLLYITVGKVAGGQPPILDLAHGGEGGHAEDASHATGAAAGAADSHGAEAAAIVATDAGQAAADAAHGAGEVLYSNPLPHVLILTAIVVGVATLAVGLALVVRIREIYGVIEEDDLHRADLAREGQP